jgi:hypothetical protein
MFILLKETLRSGKMYRKGSENSKCTCYAGQLKLRQEDFEFEDSLGYRMKPVSFFL